MNDEVYLSLGHVSVDQGAQPFSLVLAPPAVQFGLAQLELAPPVTAALRQAVQGAADLSPLGPLLPHQLPQLLILFFTPLALQGAQGVWGAYGGYSCRVLKQVVCSCGGVFMWGILLEGTMRGSHGGCGAHAGCAHVEKHMVAVHVRCSLGCSCGVLLWQGSKRYIIGRVMVCDRTLQIMSNKEQKADVRQLC